MNKENPTNLINKHFHFNFFKKIEEIFKSFSLTEKVILWLLITIATISAFVLLVEVNKNFLVDIPQKGGVVREGAIGTPRFINPLIAVSSVDRDLTSLIYSGLLKKDQHGNLIPDLADNYQISEDKLEYRFYIKSDAVFHDGKPVTSDDVIFTVLKAQDPDVESIKRAEWDGIVTERVNEKEVVFRLKQPYSAFLESTTIGILPRHLWSDIPIGGFSLSKYNIEPIGSGPYILDKIKKDANNIPTSYELKAFNDYSSKKPYISSFIFNFVSNENALLEMLKAGKIDSFAGARPEIASELKNEYTIKTSPLPRIFVIFFNQNDSKALADSNVRKALETSISKRELIDSALFGFAEIANDSIPPALEYKDSISNISSETNSESIEKNEDDRVREAKEILEKAGWKLNEEGIYTIEKNKEKIALSFNISTSRVPELIKITESVAETWRKIGANVNVKIFEVSDLNQSVIRPRNFDALLFGMVINKYSDLYAFWHSSQRIDPGLNITSYANITTDKIVGDLKEAVDKIQIQKNIQNFNAEIAKDRPVIFLYTPQFIYVSPKNVSGVNLENISSSEERFLNVHEWFIQTDKVWSIFR